MTGRASLNARLFPHVISLHELDIDVPHCDYHIV